MEIRKKLTLQFISVVASILLISSIAIYISFSQSRREEFFDRLTSKAILVSQMIVDIDEIDTELLDKIEKNNPLSLPNEQIAIYDYQNNLIYNSIKNTKLNFPINLINEIRLEGEKKIKIKNREVIGYFYKGQYDRIVVFVSAVDIFGLNKLKKLRAILIIVFISSMVIVYITGKIFTGQILTPITKLISDVDNIEASSLNIQLEVGNGKDEISKLAQTFNKMLQRLESAFNMQKNFIANASHEIRTPLTVISGQIEVDLLKDRSVIEYKKTLITILDEIKNLTSISNRLLLLAQTSSELQKISFSECRIDEILWQCRQDVLKRNSNYNIIIELDSFIDADELLMVYGNEPLLKSAFQNLIENACKYSTPAVANIFITNTELANVKITFTDKGIGIPDDDIKNIFEPFFRASNTHSIKGHGIGLSLADKITSLHKGLITVESKLNIGSTFVVTLPLINKNSSI